MSSKVLNTGESLTISSGLSILEACRVICLVQTLPEKDTELSMRAQVLYLDTIDGGAREHR